MVVGFDGSRAFVKNRTGTEEYSYQLLKALSRIDHKNSYLVYLRPGVEIRKQDWPDNFKFIPLNYAVLWTQRGLALQTFKDRLDVLFVPAHTLPLIRKPGLKTVVTVHDLGSEYLPSMHQLKQRIYLSFMQRHQLKTATKIIAVSKATKDDLIRKIGLDSKKITVIYEGFNKSLYRKLSIDTIFNTLKQYNLRPQEYFLFVGTVQPRKNLERVIRAFARFDARGPVSAVSRRVSSLASLTAGTRQDLSTLPPLAEKEILVIAGSKGWLSDELYKLPKQLGIESSVKFLGYVPDKDMAALYSGAIAFLYPSLFEGFGLPILEAQACGCPVLTSNLSSMPEVAGDAAVLVDPYSVDDIVKGMEQINNQETRNKLIKKGFDNIKRFSWEKAAKETLKVLTTL